METQRLDADPQFQAACGIARSFVAKRGRIKSARCPHERGQRQKDHESGTPGDWPRTPHTPFLASADSAETVGPSKAVEAILATRRVSITIGFTAPVKDKSEVGPHELLLTFGFSSTPPALFLFPLPSKAQCPFFCGRVRFFCGDQLLFYTAEKPEKSPDRGVRGPGCAARPYKNRAGRPIWSPRSVF